MKVLLRRAIVALGFSFVCCFSLIGPLVSPGHRWTYHNSGSTSSVVLAVLFTIIGICLLFTLLMTLAVRSGRTRVWLWSWMILMTPWLLLKGVVILFVWRFPHRLSVTLFLASLLCWVAVASLWRPSFAPLLDRFHRFSVTLFSFAGLCAVLVVSEMLWYFQAESMHTAGVLHASTIRAVEVNPQRPRVIWIILDELSYQQVYERRFPSLNLPAFDQLAKQSTVFTHVVPAAAFTEDAVPSMMRGLPVDDIRIGKDDTLRSLHDPVTGIWHPFDEENTVFRDALGYGFRTAVSGWYNPYCRIIPKVLDECFWVSRERTVDGMSSDASVLKNMEAPWIYVANKFGFDRMGEKEANKAAAQAHVSDYQEIILAGDRFLEDPSIDFLLLHVPVPHPGGIYDRRARALTTHLASYIDNLALADRYLAHVHELLDQRGEWDSSAVVVMGDHSWRTKLLWVGTPYWTAEDQAASHGGQFDDRPAYIVKLPHQTAAAHVDSHFAAVRTRDLFDGILDGSIRTAPDLAAFSQRSSVTR